jgi:rhodanese-related sulfurtransferase
VSFTNKIIALIFLLSVTAVNGSFAQTANIADVTATEAAALLSERPDIVPLDIRTGWEVSGGSIKNATHIDYFSWNFSEKITQLDPDKTYLVFCHAGGRSDRTLKIMQEAGIKNIYHMKDGMSAWKKADLPVEEWK